jgi:hypothetical protein
MAGCGDAVFLLHFVRAAGGVQEYEGGGLSQYFGRNLQRR